MGSVRGCRPVACRPVQDSAASPNVRTASSWTPTAAKPVSAIHLLRRPRAIEHSARRRRPPLPTISAPTARPSPVLRARRRRTALAAGSSSAAHPSVFRTCSASKATIGIQRFVNAYRADASPRKAAPAEASPRSHVHARLGWNVHRTAFRISREPVAQAEGAPPPLTAKGRFLNCVRNARTEVRSAHTGSAPPVSAKQRFVSSRLA